MTYKYIYTFICYNYIILTSVCYRKYNDEASSSPNIAACMEGKLKEKLESVGIAALCLCQGSANPAQSICKYCSDHDLPS